MVNVTDLAQRYTVQDLPEYGQGIGTWFTIDGLRTRVLPPFATQMRERALRDLDRDDYQLAWSGAVAGLLNRWSATPWEIKGDDDSVRHFQNVLRDAHFGAGWSRFLKMLMRDYLRQDRGAFIELIGAGEPDGAIVGPVVGIAHLDSLRCYPTGDPEYPVMYYAREGSVHKMHRTRIVQLLDMPDGDDLHPGYGRCALSRAVMVVQRELLLNQFIATYLDDKPPPGLNIFHGISETEFKNAYQQFLRRRQSDERVAFGDQLNFFKMGDNGVDIKTLTFSQAPEKFDFQQYVEIGINQLALALGVDKLDLWEITSSGLGSGAQAEIMASKSKGRTYGDALKQLERVINDILSDDCEFAFKPRDPEDDASAANSASAWAGAISVMGDRITDDEARQLLANQVEAVYDAITDAEGNVRRMDDVRDQVMPDEDVTADDADALDTGEDAPAQDVQVQMAKAVSTSGYFYLDLADDPSIKAVQRQLQAQLNIDDVEWQLPKTYHVTLAYVDRLTDEQMRAAVIYAVAKSQPLMIAGSKLSIFNNDPAAIHIVVDLTDALKDLQQKLYTILDGMGLEQSEYSIPAQYKPHITMAYVPKDTPVPAIEFQIATLTTRLIAARGEYDPVIIASLPGEVAVVASEKSYSDTRAAFTADFMELVKSAVAGHTTRRRFGIVLRAQLNRMGRAAYSDGLREGGVEEGLDDDDREAIADWLAQQSGFVTKFADEVYRRSLTDSEIGYRAELWANKSLERARQMGLASADRNGLYEWSLGQTEEHCTTCLALNGQRHRLKEYVSRNLLPKSSALSCKGYNCDCNLRKVKGRASGRFPKVKAHDHAMHGNPRPLRWWERLGSTSKPGMRIVKGADGRRLMLIVTSNSYIDRDNEIISRKALERYVDECWKGDTYVGDNVHLLWHGGEPIGDIIYAGMKGKFLVEVSRERPDKLIRLGSGRRARVKAVWDALEATQSTVEYGASHGFAYRPAQRDGNVYGEIYKYETSTLPLASAANAYTFSGVVNNER